MYAFFLAGEHKVQQVFIGDLSMSWFFLFSLPKQSDYGVIFIVRHLKGRLMLSHLNSRDKYLYQLTASQAGRLKSIQCKRAFV